MDDNNEQSLEEALEALHAEAAELVPFMDDVDKQFISEVVNVGKPIWQPHPENKPQQMAYYSEADIIGYGGAAGGGKTDLAIGLALTQHKKAVFFREESKQLQGIQSRIEEILGTRDGLSTQFGTWRNAGRPDCQLEFGTLKNPGDENKQQGRAKDLVVLEEAANLKEHMCRHVMGWVRDGTDPHQRKRVLMTFNPPTSVEGRWVISYFAPWIDRDYAGIRAASGEIRWFAVLPDKNTGESKDVEVPTSKAFVIEEDGSFNFDFDPNKYQGAESLKVIKPKSRTFIASSVHDNKCLPDYASTLQALPEPLRSQMLYGDFYAGIQDDPWQVCPTDWVEAAMARWQPRIKKGEMLSVGVDVSRGGVDRTFIACRHDTWWINELVEVPQEETLSGNTLAGRIIAETRDGAPQHVDLIGVGTSPVDFLRQANQPVVPVTVSKAVNKKDKTGLLKFKNTRSFLWWSMRELLDPQNDTGIQLPRDSELKRELCTPKFSIEGSTIKVQSSDDIKKELKRSVDRASAVLLAIIETPKTHLLGQQFAKSQNSGYNNGYTPYGGKQEYRPYSRF